VIALPRPLASWAKHLGIFPSDIALCLGVMAARIAGLVGDLGRRHALEGEPEGVTGLSRRGPYERLLLTEWLLHDELPDEFIRRVVAGEHSFLERGFRRDAADRRSVVLFDAGPAQLGAPRVAHLAVLVALAQRADRARGVLAWGVLQDEQLQLFDAITPITVGALLRGRSSAPVLPRHLAQWERKLAVDGPSQRSELWFVGPRGLGTSAEERHASLVAVDEVLTPSQPGAPGRVAIHVAAPGERPRDAVLDLPPARLAVSLLRDPFGATVARSDARSVPLSRTLQRTSNIGFSADSRRLYLRAESGALLSCQIPNSPRASAGPPGFFVPPPDQHIVAVGQSRTHRATIVVARDASAFYVHRLSKKGNHANATHRYPLIEDYQSSPIAHLRPLGVLSAECVTFVDGEGRAVLLRGGNDAQPEMIIAEVDCSGVSRALPKGLVYVNHASTWRLRLVRPQRNGEAETVTSSVDITDYQPELPLFFGGWGEDDLLTYARGARVWIAVQHGKRRELHVAEDWDVVGIVDPGVAGSEARLVVVDRQRRHIALGHDAEQTVVTTASPIVHAAASHASSDIAYFTESGEVGVYSCAAGATVLRLFGEKS